MLAEKAELPPDSGRVNKVEAHVGSEEAGTWPPPHPEECTCPFVTWVSMAHIELWEPCLLLSPSLPLSYMPHVEEKKKDQEQIAVVSKKGLEGKKVATGRGKSQVQEEP